MAKVLGIGGIFFKSKDPKALSTWYEKWLGLEIEASFGGSIFRSSELPKDAYAVWSPFDHDTDYFAPSDQAYMFNLVVDDLAEALNQVAEGGAKTHGQSEEEGLGLFGWFTDPEGNKVELWQLANNTSD